MDGLRKVGVVPVDGVMSFVARDHIEAANVRPGHGFEEHFLDLREEGPGALMIVRHELDCLLYDRTIIGELGGGIKVTILVAQLFWLIERQPKGGAGALATSGKANICYPLGADKKNWTVFAAFRRVEGFWFVDASRIEDGKPWTHGCNVFSQHWPAPADTL